MLFSCTSRIKSDIQMMRNALLRVIGLPRAVAKINQNIIDANDFILNSCLQRTNTSIHSQSPFIYYNTPSPFPFTIPRRNTERFKLNAVMITLIHLRDQIYGTWRKKPHPVNEPQSRHIPSVTVYDRICTNPACKNPTNTSELWQR